MPNPGSLTPSVDAEYCDKTKTRNVSSEIGIPKYPAIPSGSLAEFYKPRENLPDWKSYSKLQKIINEEFKVEYEDLKFPAGPLSLGVCKSLAGNSIEWKRPHEIASDPKFFVDGSSNFDIAQGLLKNCSFLAAVASLATRRDLLEQVVPMEQGFDESYAGIFRFRFWQYGKWVDVVVDDYLPTYIEGDKDKGEEPVMKLFGAQPASGNIFWLPLLEKAYAKLHGSYRAIEGPENASKNLKNVSSGWPSDTMEDFTGGISEYYSAALNGNTKKAKEVEEKLDCFNLAREALKNESLVTCNFLNWVTERKNGTTEEEYDNEGWPRQTWPNHWSITQHFSISKPEKEKSFLRIRYPDHENSDFTRKLDDRFEKMEGITDLERNELKIHVDSNPLRKGEFIMSEKEFKEKCTSIEICQLNLNQFTNSVKKEWKLIEIHGEWSGTSAGGLTKTTSPSLTAATYETNPRYLFKLETEGYVIIALMQKHQWKNDPTGAKLRQIGFDIYSMKEDVPLVLPYPLNMTDLKSKAEKVKFNKHKSASNEKKTETFPAPDSMQHQKYTRESNCRLQLKRGYHCIVVHTDKDGADGNFFLRIFSNTEIPRNHCCNGAIETPITCKNV